MSAFSYLTHLECSRCGQWHNAEQTQTVSVCCGKPLLARYDLARARGEWQRESLAGRPATMWRYQELLPVRQETEIVSLGEGMTPLLRCQRLGRRWGITGRGWRAKIKGKSQQA